MKGNLITSILKFQTLEIHQTQMNGFQMKGIWIFRHRRSKNSFIVQYGKLSSEFVFNTSTRLQHLTIWARCNSNRTANVVRKLTSAFDDVAMTYHVIFYPCCNFSGGRCTIGHASIPSSFLGLNWKRFMNRKDWDMKISNYVHKNAWSVLNELKNLQNVKNPLVWRTGLIRLAKITKSCMINRTWTGASSFTLNVLFIWQHHNLDTNVEGLCARMCGSFRPLNLANLCRPRHFTAIPFSRAGRCQCIK
jgi:hypothetical protein